MKIKRRKPYLLIIFLACLLVVSGCTQMNSEEKLTEEIVKLYFADKENTDYVLEERQLSLSDPKERYKLTLEQLIKGPENKDYRANIPPDTKVYGTIRQNDDLIINLSREFLQFEGSVAEIIAVGSVVNTIAQFGIVRVKILVEGEELIGPSGLPRGFMEAEERVTDKSTEQIVKLYFSNEDATALKSESRIIHSSKDSSREQLLLAVLEELIAGPTISGLNRTIPPEVKVFAVSISGETAVINFSEEMHTQHWGGATGESMTINSIVNTLTEFDYIQEVKMMVTGEPMTIKHIVLEDPVRRNDSIIQE